MERVSVPGTPGHVYRIEAFAPELRARRVAKTAAARDAEKLHPLA